LEPLALFGSVVAEQPQSDVGDLDARAHQGQLDAEHVGEAAGLDAVAMLAGFPTAGVQPCRPLQLAPHGADRRLAHRQL